MQTLNSPVNKDSHAAADANNSSVISLAQSSFLHTALGGLDLRLDEELERYRHWQDNGMSYLKPFQPQSQKENNFGGLGVGLGGDSFVNASAYPPAKPKLPRQSIDLPNPMAATTSSPAPVNPGVTPYSVSGKTNQTTLQPQSAAQPSPLPKPQSNSSRPPVDEPLPLHTPRLELPLEPLNTEYGGNGHGNNNGTYNANYNGSPNNGNGNYNGATMPQPVPQAFVIPPIASATAPEPPLRDADAVNQPVTEDEFLKNLSDIYPETPNLVEEEPLPPPPPHPAVVIIASLLNPVGLISLLLLLVSSATIGYLLVDPSGVIRIFNPSYGKVSPAVKSHPSEEPTENHSPKSNSRQRTETTTIPFVPSTGSAGALTTPNGLPATVPANSTAKTSPAPTTGNNPNNGRTNQTPTPGFNRNTPVANDAPRNNASTNSVTPLALPPVVNEPPAEAPRPVSRPASRPASRVIPAAPVATRPTRNSNTTAASSSMGSGSTMAASSGSNSSSSSGNSNNGVRYGAPLTSLPMATESATTRPSSYRVSVDSEYAQQAQKVQPDAFTRSSDGQTQLGSYRDPNAAAQRVEELRRQGIPAKVE